MRRILLAAIGLLAACDGSADFTVKASGLTSLDALGLMTIDVVQDGELLQRLELDLSTDTEIMVPDLLIAGGRYGVAAFLDMDGDGVCTADPVDVPWFFIYVPALNTDFVWEPDPTEAPLGGQACSWFVSHPTDLAKELEPEEDTDEDTDA
jgi:hypothetical protein